VHSLSEQDIMLESETGRYCMGVSLAGSCPICRLVLHPGILLMVATPAQLT